MIVLVGVVALTALVGFLPEIHYRIQRRRGRIPTVAQQFELDMAEWQRAAQQRVIWRRRRNRGIYWKPGMGVYSMSAAGAA